MPSNLTKYVNVPESTISPSASWLDAKSMITYAPPSCLVAVEVGVEVSSPNFLNVEVGYTVTLL